MSTESQYLNGPFTAALLQYILPSAYSPSVMDENRLSVSAKDAQNGFLCHTCFNASSVNKIEYTEGRTILYCANMTVISLYTDQTRILVSII